MNIELYITILESSVEHLNKLQNLLSAKYRALDYSGISKDGVKLEEENMKMILREIEDTANKIQEGAICLLSTKE